MAGWNGFPACIFQAIVLKIIAYLSSFKYYTCAPSETAIGGPSNSTFHVTSYIRDAYVCNVKNRNVVDRMQFLKPWQLTTTIGSLRELPSEHICTFVIGSQQSNNTHLSDLRYIQGNVLTVNHAPALRAINRSDIQLPNSIIQEQKLCATPWYIFQQYNKRIYV
jgi:hypothetical protein